MERVSGTIRLIETYYCDAEYRGRWPFSTVGPSIFAFNRILRPAAGRIGGCGSGSWFFSLVI